MSEDSDINVGHLKGRLGSLEDLEVSMDGVKME